MLGVLASVAAIAAGARAYYLRSVDRKEASRFPLGPEGVVVGAARIELSRAGAPAVLLLHGSGETPQVVAGLAEHLHARGFAVYAPLLSGHGRTLSALGDVKPGDWLTDARRELAAIREGNHSVAIVGLSLGGALAVSLAAEHEDVQSIVLLAPYLSMPPILRGFAVTSRIWGWLLPHFSSFSNRSIHDAAAARRSLGRGMLTPAALRALLAAVRDGTRALPLVATPALMIQSKEENRISIARAERTFAQLGSADKKLVWVEGAGHVITVDYGHERVYDMTASWLETHSESLATSNKEGPAH